MNGSLSHDTGLSVSIVVYQPDQAELQQTLRSLSAACERLSTSRLGASVEWILVDNGGLSITSAALADVRRDIACRVLAGHGNIGYGRGHNRAIELVTSRFHLILNPDIDLDPDALVAACTFLDEHPDVGLLTPRIDREGGKQQFLCRRYPTIIDLFARGFLPVGTQKWVTNRLARYEMRDQVSQCHIVWDPPIVSGCFMLFRTEVLKQLGGFDPRYFLYFEDYDLSLRTHEVARVAYVPSVRVVHYGGGASRKGFAHIRMFVASAFKFFNRFGWRWW